MRISRIYCDLDGVLANFDKRIEELTGVPVHKISDDGIIWKAVSKQPDFWESLDWMPDGEELWAHLNLITELTSHELDLHILTGTPSSKKFEAEVGKVAWVNKMLKSHYKHPMEHLHVFMCMSKSKYLYARPNHLLIDDREKNINEWRAAGGIAIHHKDAYTTKQELSEMVRNGQIVTYYKHDSV